MYSVTKTIAIPLGFALIKLANKPIYENGSGKVRELFLECGTGTAYISFREALGPNILWDHLQELNFACSIHV